MARWVVLVLAVVSLAGCTDSSGDADAVGEQIALDAETVVDAGHGVLACRVVNDQGQPLSGARASLLSTNFFGSTNSTGDIEFVNVPEGEWDLSVTISGFLPAKVTVAIHSGNKTELVVQMVPEVVGGAGYRPHVHDYWGGQDTYPLLDTDIDMTRHKPTDLAHPVPTRGVTAPILGSDDGWPIPLRSDDEDQKPIVLPGTARLEVSFSSDDATMTRETWGLRYRNPASGGYVDLEPQTFLEPFTIDVSPEAWDSGHQTFSFWSFAILPSSKASDAPAWEPGLAHGSINVVMTLYRGGEILLEPGHRVFWEDGDEEIVRDYEVVETKSKGCCSWSWFNFGMDEGKLVPPGTEKLTVTFTATPTTATATTTPDGFRLIFRPADVSPHEEDTSRYLRPTPLEASGNTVVYEIALEPGQADAFYQTYSNWRAYVTTPDVSGDGQTYWYGEFDFQLGVVATRG